MYSSNLELNPSKFKELIDSITEYFPEDKRREQFEAYSRISSKIFKCKEEIGADMDRLSKITKYNLKYLRSNNPDNLTFSCSCSSSSKKALKSMRRKRENPESCKFRITFLKSLNGFYNFHSLLNKHNHEPNRDVIDIYIIIFSQFKLKQDILSSHSRLLDLLYVVSFMDL